MWSAGFDSAQEEQHLGMAVFLNLVLGPAPVGKVWEPLGYANTIQQK